jgi:hypothetical protein
MIIDFLTPKLPGNNKPEYPIVGKQHKMLPEKRRKKISFFYPDSSTIYQLIILLFFFGVTFWGCKTGLLILYKNSLNIFPHVLV